MSLTEDVKYVLHQNILLYLILILLNKLVVQMIIFINLAYEDVYKNVGISKSPLQYLYF